MGTMNQNIMKGMSNFIHGVKKEDVQKQYGEITEIIEIIERIKPFYTKNPPAVEESEKYFVDEYNQFLRVQEEKGNGHYIGIGGRSKSRKNAKRNKRRKTNRRRRA